MKPLANGDKAVALFNESEVNATISTTAEQLGLPRSIGYTVRDLWQHKNFQSAGADLGLAAAARHRDVPGQGLA